MGYQLHITYNNECVMNYLRPFTTFFVCQETINSMFDPLIITRSNMKKIILSAACLMGGLVLHAQDVDFGITAGYLNADGKVEGGGISVSGSESGFYIGAVADFTITEEFHIQPEAVYASIDEADGILVPIMAKYYVADKLNLQAGPQFVFSLEDTPDEISSIQFGLGGGLGYDITDDFFIEARYSFQLSNSYTGSEDITVRSNYLNIGVGYTF